MFSDARETNPCVPKLNLGGFKTQNAPPIPNIQNLPQNNTKPKPEIKAIVLEQPKTNLENIKQKDFQEEFMDKYDEFSQSWRDLIEQERRY
jgi:hypothetical protein